MTPEEKSQALRDTGRSLVGKSFVRGSLRITVTQEPEIDERGRLVVWVSATRDGVSLDLDLPFVYVNPPVGVRLADDTVKVDHLLAIKEIVAQTVDQF